MKDKLFELYRSKLESLILPPEDFRLFCDRPEGFTLREEYREQAIAQGEALLHKTYPLLPLSTYLLFARTGNRIGFEAPYLERRTDLMALLTAEAYEGQGRFIDPIMDLTWAILEESSWVLPAHVNPDGRNPQCMPFPYEGDRHYTDLFAGTTGACLAWVWYLCRDKFDAISPLINQRILENLRDRVIIPYAEHNTEQYWMGYPPQYWMNNWCPWIISNVLTVCALTVSDPALRERVVDYALMGLDRFAAMYGEDGGCNEGPNYWQVAGGALYNACLVLYDMTGGKINAFSHPLIKNMGEFFPKMYICNGYFLNFADASSKLPVNYAWGHDWGKLSDSELMQNFWEFAYKKENTYLVGYNAPYREFRSLCIPPFDHRDFRASKSEYFPSLGLSVCRDEEDAQRGLYLSLKGGHNAESHNHLDVGNFVVFCDGTPVFIDAGVGTYTARTFGVDRYDIWSMQSCYHNLPTLNGVDQEPGGHFAAKNAVFEEESGKLTLDLTAAYPAKAGMESLIRSAWIENGRAVVRDELTSREDGEVTFNLLCNCEPVFVKNGEFTVQGKTVHYDPALTMTVDIPDCTWPETLVIPSKWDCECLYRIRLTAPLQAGKKQTFQIEVCR